MGEDDRDDEPLGERPPPDRLSLAVTRARIVKQLFSEDVRVEIGRYQLLERVGAGGMGVVWGAWDPRLERRVAIKVMSAQLGAARDAILEEGQALAKLSHPNVVPVYDVGVVDGSLYLVMEWVRGANLRQHCREPRSIRAIIELFREAGQGLLAAHDAGLVHRDFKPENAMVGDDGRVRVVDFGIALAATPATPATTASAGTPRYMPEEQRRGGPVTAASDQYAFCVALREIVAARAGDDRATAIPAWIDAIVSRGTAAEPADRYPDMRGLLRALARDPGTLRRRRIIAGVVSSVMVGAVAAAFAFGRRSGEPERCTGSAAEVDAVWNAGARDRLLAHVRALGAYGVEEAAHLDGELGAYRTRWIDAHRDACLAHARGELTVQLYERGLGCLARARASFATVIDVTSRVPADRLANAVVASRALPAPDRCGPDAVASSIAPPPPPIAGEVGRIDAELARVRVLAIAADPEVRRVAAEAAAAAGRLGYPPLVARAQLVLGTSLMEDVSSMAESVDAFERAGAAALDAGEDPGFVEAFARELYVLPRLPSPPTAATVSVAAIPTVRRIAMRSGPAGAFARALLYNNAGTERLSAGDLAGARRWFKLAIDEPRSGEGDAELWSSYGNLALATESRDERDHLFRQERDQLERLLGPHHAFTLEARRTAALFLEDPRSAIAELRDICTAIDHWHPDRAVPLQQCNYELGWLEAESGDRARAREAMLRATRGDEPSAANALAFAALLDDQAGQAAGAADSAAARLAANPAWWVRFYAVDAYAIAALARDRLGDAARAIAALRRALALLDDASFNRSATYYLRRLAHVRAALARHLAASDPAQAAGLAGAAIAWYREARGYEDRIAELTPITAVAGSR